MGTRGYVVVKLNNKYYKIYNYRDSYPSNLGQNVISILKCIQLEANKECVYKILNLVNKEGYQEIEEQEEPIKTDIFIEWVYTVDLNRKTLTISGGYYQPTYIIDKITDNWFEDFSEQNERIALQSNSNYENEIVNR